MTSQQYFALRLIDLYQQRISPRKGFVCAHNALHREGGCSGFGKAAVAGYGVIKGIGLIAVRLVECAVSAAVLQAASLDSTGGRMDPQAEPPPAQDDCESALEDVAKIMGLDCATNTACCLVLPFC